MKTDSRIQTDVMQELKWDPSIHHEKIGVSVTDGVVTLSGSVPSFSEKQAAEKAVQTVAGVKAVVEKIEVKLPGISVRTDQDIAAAVRRALEWDVQVPDKSIKVRVEEGRVELTGEVEWIYQKLAAERCVTGLTGVRLVANRITLKEAAIEPEMVRKRIKEAILRKAENDAKNIAVEVQGHKVLLSGNVRSYVEIQDAKNAAWSAPGVSNVESRLHITGL